jgi:signal transduction histidine kinase
MRSLRFKILIAMVAVTALGSSITAIVASRATADLFRQYASRPMGKREEPFVRILVQRYSLNGRWESVQPLVVDLGQAIEERVILAESGGTIIGDSESKLTGKIMAENIPAIFFPIIASNQLVGKLYIDPFNDRDIRDNLFLGRVNHSFLVGSLVVIGLALLITLIITRPIIRPIEQLTDAVQKMEKGDLSVRVNIPSRDETGRLAHAFNKMAETMDRLMQLRRNMVSDVAHELRTPLTNIRGYLEASKDGLLKPDENLVNNLYEEAMLLNRLVDDLQDLALVEAGHITLDLQPVEIGGLIQATVDLYQSQAASFGLSLESDVEADLPSVHADTHRMMQVLRNLVNNAMAHTPRGGRIAIRARAENGGGIHIIVEDNGVGIPADQLDLIFERLCRVDHSRERATGGGGLGLSIVKQLVEMQGGKVWAESETGKGSQFHIVIPSTPADKI